MSLNFSWPRPHLVLWAGSRAACGKIKISGTPNCLNYCEMFVLYTQFTNVAAGRGLETHAICHSAVTICQVKSIPNSWKLLSRAGYFILKNDLGCLKHVRNITENLSLIYNRLCTIFIHPILHTDQLSKQKQK